MVCSIAGFENIINNSIIPLASLASVTTAIIIGVTYMISQAISNPKLSLWAKTEAVQLFLSAITVVMLITVMNSFCSIKVNDVGALFGKTADSISIYEAAQTYLVDAAYYSQRALVVVRYHLEAYNILAALNVFECIFNGLGCLFGYSGDTIQPLGGYGAHMGALNIFFNSAIMSTMSALNYLFILQFVYKGFVLMFLPLGIFMRAMPYMRTFGALLIAVTISFLIVYPFILSLFYLMEDALLDKPEYQPEDFSSYYGEASKFGDASGSGQSAGAGVYGADYVIDEYFPSGDRPAGAIAFAVYAFIGAVFMPTAALLATIGSTVYITRLYGEEIDMSRLVQML
jgi:hypothetical protein